MSSQTAETVTVRHGQEEWIVSVLDGRVVITQCAGAFGLPTKQVSIFGGCGESVAKAISKAAKRTKPRKVA